MYAYKKWLCLLLIFHFAVQENVIKIHGRSIVEQPTSIKAGNEFLPLYTHPNNYYFADHLNENERNKIKYTFTEIQRLFVDVGTIRIKDNIPGQVLLDTYFNFVAAARSIPRLHAKYRYVHTNYIKIKNEDPAYISDYEKEFLIFGQLGPMGFIRWKEENYIDFKTLQGHRFDQWNEFTEVEGANEMTELLKEKLNIQDDNAKAQEAESQKNEDDNAKAQEAESQKNEFEVSETQEAETQEAEDANIEDANIGFETTKYESYEINRIYTLLLLNPYNCAFDFFDCYEASSLPGDNRNQILENYDMAEKKKMKIDIKILAKERKELLTNLFSELREIYNKPIPEKYLQKYKMVLNNLEEKSTKINDPEKESKKMALRELGLAKKFLKIEALPTPSQLIGSDPGLMQPTPSATTASITPLTASLMTGSAFGIMLLLPLAYRLYNKRQKAILYEQEHALAT